MRRWAVRLRLALIGLLTVGLLSVGLRLSRSCLALILRRAIAAGILL